MTDDLRFRRAGIDDAARIVDLVQSAYRGEASRSGWTTEADLLDGQRTDLDAVQTLLRQPGTWFLLAEGEHDLIACAHLNLDGDAAEFGMFAVRPGMQARGIGARMLAEAERLALTEGAQTRMRMRVIDLRHELIAWYERRGYQRTGASEPFPYGDPRFGLPRRDDLRFAVLEKPLPGADA